VASGKKLCVCRVPCAIIKAAKLIKSIEFKNKVLVIKVFEAD